jgi:hypothetical protein
MSIDSAVALAQWQHEDSTQALRELLSRTHQEFRAHIQQTSSHAIGSMRFQVESNDSRAHTLLTRCLLSAPELLPIAEPEQTQAPAFTLSLWTADAVPHRAPPQWNLPHTDARHLERLHLSQDRQFSAYFDVDRGFWLVLDKATRRAMAWLPSLDAMPFWEEAAPFKQIIQWWMDGSAMTLLHGGVVTDGRHGILLTGPGGSGKSTTVAACLQAGLGVCGDDLIAVERVRVGWLSHSAYDAVKLCDSSTIPAPPVLANAPSSPCGDKRLVRYSDTAKNSQVPSTPLNALVHCVISGGAVSRLTPLPPAALLMALGPSTAFMLRGRESHILAQAGQLVRGLPCFRLALGQDPSQAATLLKEWIGSFTHG